MRSHFNWSPKETLPSPGSQRHGPHNQFFINPALKLCPGCGQFGSGNHVRSSWVFYMLPWHISNLGWPTLPLPTWLLPVQEGKSPGWEARMAEQVLAGKGWAGSTSPCVALSEEIIHVICPDGWMAHCILQILVGWLRCILEKKTHPKMKKLGSPFGIQRRGKACQTKTQRLMFHPPNNPVFLLSLQVLCLVSEKWYLLTVSEDRRLWVLGSLRRKEKQTWSPVA